MKIKLSQYQIVILLLAITLHAGAQNLKIKNFSIGWRIFEINAVGNNPTTITPFLNEPVSYENYLRNIKYNSLFGNPGVLNVQNFYINAEWYKIKPLSRFWKKYTLQAGLLTNKITKPAGAIADEGFYYSTDTSKYVNKYSLTQKLQFFGANVGINRRINISKKLQFITGLHVQGSLALLHYYKQQWDSSTYSPSNGWKTNTTQLQHLKGKNFFQWQLMVPLGLEYEVYKKQFYIRIEVDAGIVGSKYIGKTFADKEAHGAGIWFIYHK